jgi:molecular chaperone DnaJ
MSNKDYYSVLGIEKSASKDDVKKAFRKLAHQYHPDKQGGDEQKFKEIGEAYSVLGDDKKRAEYDAYGRTFNGGGGPQAGGFDFSGFDFGGFGGQQGGVEFDLGDMFGSFFGGGRPRARRGRDISIDIELTFKDAIFGVERRVLIAKVGTCNTCNGSGAKKGSEMVTCTTCNGAGKVHETRQTMLGVFSTSHECTVCHGTGKVPKEKCPTCSGHGVMRKEEEVVIAVPAGIENGEMIRLTGGGEAMQGGTPGDLYVKVHVKEDKRYRREGADLVRTLEIKLTDALLGATHKVDTLDGELSVKVPQGVTFGERLRVKGKGIPTRGSSRGDLYFEINIHMPGKLSKAAQKAMETLRAEGV